jgi:hypothetical protein
MFALIIDMETVMTSTLRTMLFATALFPVAALAQDANTQQQDPLLVPDATGQTTQGTTTQDPATQDLTQDPTIQDPSMQDTGTTVTVDPAPAPATTDQAQQPVQQDVDVIVQPQDGTQMQTGTDVTVAQQPGVGGPFVTVPPTGAWRVADLTGKDVIGIDGENIGDINDVIITQDGQVMAIIVGVGGFLGIGQKDVAVSMDAMQFGPGMTPDMVATADQPVIVQQDGTVDQTGAVGTTVQPRTDGDLAMTDTGATDVTIGDDGLPDRIVLNVTRQQLEDAPAFEGIRAHNQQPLQ